MILAIGCNITKSEKFKGVWILSVPTVYIYIYIYILHILPCIRQYLGMIYYILCAGHSMPLSTHLNGTFTLLDCLKNNETHDFYILKYALTNIICFCFHLETMAGTLKLVTWNTCGIRDTADLEQKKNKIGQRLNELQASVAFLQETHIGINDVSHVKDFGGWKSFYSVHHPRSKGVAILIKNELPFEHIKHDIEPTGSYIVLVCKLYGKCFTLVNVYNHAK